MTGWKYIIALVCSMIFWLNLSAQESKPDCDSLLTLKDPQILPQFPGGKDSLNKFIQENTILPADLFDSYIQGSVYVQFTVDRNGKIHNIIIIKGVTKEYNDIAISIIKKMPKWIPGKIGETPICTTLVVPVKFILK
jgi:TonB family protein